MPPLRPRTTPCSSVSHIQDYCNVLFIFPSNTSFSPHFSFVNSSSINVKKFNIESYSREIVIRKHGCYTGVITTQHFGEKFMTEQVERKPRYTIYVYPPESVKDNENVTLHLKVDKSSMKGLARGSEDEVFTKGQFYGDETHQYTNFTPPFTDFSPSEESKYPYITLSRDVSADDVARQDVMPGFTFSWWYTTNTGTEITPDSKYNDIEMTKHFVR